MISKGGVEYASWLISISQSLLLVPHPLIFLISLIMEVVECFTGGNQAKPGRINITLPSKQSKKIASCG